MMPFLSRMRAFRDAATSAAISIEVTMMFPETKPPDAKSMLSPHIRAQVIGFVLCDGFQ